MKESIVAETISACKKGREYHIKGFHIAGHELVLNEGFVKRLQLKDDWYHELNDPLSFISALVNQKTEADIFTFIEMPPVQEPRYNYYLEWENLAAIPLGGYDYWWQKQINSAARGHVRKAQKTGISFRVAKFDKEFLSGIKEIYDETPVRQGKPFWHYRKDLEYLLKIHETFLDRSDFLGAYFGGELVGFVKLVYSGDTAHMMHVISKNSHRDKSVTNGLIAFAVRASCEKRLKYLAYDKFDYEVGGSPSLLLFKINNGFKRVEFPRYYVPLTAKGRIIIKLRLHHGLLPLVPDVVVNLVLSLRNGIRNKWYQYRYRNWGSL